MVRRASWEGTVTLASATENSEKHKVEMPTALENGDLITNSDHNRGSRHGLG